jgi:hypothetical protein
VLKFLSITINMEGASSGLNDRLRSLKVLLNQARFQQICHAICSKTETGSFQQQQKATHPVNLLWVQW